MTTHSAFSPQLQGLTQLVLKHALSVGHSLLEAHPIWIGGLELACGFRKPPENGVKGATVPTVHMRMA